MEYLPQFFDCFEAITLCLCPLLLLKAINELIDLYEKFKSQITSNKLEDVLRELINERKEEKHNKED